MRSRSSADLHPRCSTCTLRALVLHLILHTATSVSAFFIVRSNKTQQRDREMESHGTLRQEVSTWIGSWLSSQPSRLSHRKTDRGVISNIRREPRRWCWTLIGWNEMRSIYVNGLTDCIHSSSGPLQTNRSTPLTTGFTILTAPYFFDGLMDEVSLLGQLLSWKRWTHLCQTYSLSRGVRLFVNGSLFNASLPCDYPSRSSLPVLTLGSSLQSVNSTCTGGSIQMRQYRGYMNEFRVYSRELNSSDVLQLAH